MRYSKNKDFHNHVAALVESGKWMFIPKGHRKHGYLKHESGRKCPVPGSPRLTRQIELGLG